MREQMASRKFVAMAITANTPGAPVTKLVADEIVNAYRRYSKPLFLFTPNGDCARAALEMAKDLVRTVNLGCVAFGSVACVAISLARSRLPSAASRS